MKIIITFILIFFSTSFLVGQTNFKAIYSATFQQLDYDSIFNKNKKYSKEIQQMIKNEQKIFINIANNSKFILEFNRKKSKFYHEKKLEISKNLQKGYLIRVGFDGNYYSIKNKNYQLINAYGEDFIISSSLVDWKITQEKRKIGKYTCYKATTYKEIENSRGIHRIPVIAWFSKVIPFNYGPKEYNGLPGLIIQLEEGNIFYRLKELQKIDEVKINIPIKGKKITTKEFNALSKKLYKTIKN